VLVLSDVATTFLSSNVVLTPNGQFLDYAIVAFSERYTNDPVTLGELLTSNNTTQLRNSGTDAFKIKSMWENQMKERVLRFEGE